MASAATAGAHRSYYKNGGRTLNDAPLTGKRREILDFIAAEVRERGYPPSVREIGSAVGLASTSTVQAHLNTLQKQGFLRRDPTKPRGTGGSLRRHLRRRHRAPSDPPRTARW